MYAGNSVVVNLGMRWPILIPIAAAIGIFIAIPKQAPMVQAPVAKVAAPQSPPKVEDPVMVPTPAIAPKKKKKG
jgi:hypothetical protein